MIVQNERGDLIFLNTKSASYVLWIDQWKCLHCLHFGGKIAGNVRYLGQTEFKSFSPTPPDILIEGVSPDLTANEYPDFGQGDFRSPAAVIRRKDGTSHSRFRYCSHEVFRGVPACEGLPHVRQTEGAETLTVRLADAISGVEIFLYYVVFEGLDVIVRHAEFYNPTAERVLLERAYSFSVDLAGTRRDILTLHGQHLGERMPVRRAVTRGRYTVSSARGASSHQDNPFLALLSPSCTEEEGECMGVTLLYSGSFALSVEEGQTGLLRLQGGINDENFRWRLEPGARFVTPQAVLAWSQRGLGALSRTFADLFRESVLPRRYAYARRPIVINNWEATYFDFTTDTLLPFIDEAAKLGADTFVLDDGWFGARNSDRAGLGDWFVNEEKLPGGLGALISRCKEHGMRFGLWIEPEMISRDSALFCAHPDWAVGREGERCESRHQYVLDFSRSEVRDEIFARIAALLRAYEISYIKWDMNRHITECCSAGLPAEGQGEFLHRYVLGVYEFARRLTEEFPNVLFEGCAGGGGRFDGGMLYYFPQIWTSDNTDAYDRTRIQYGTSIAYPLSAMSCHVSACPNHQTGRVTPLASRGLVASLGATGYELDPSKLTKEEREQIALQIRAYRAIEPLILRGDCYRLCDPFADNYFCMAVVAKDGAEAYVVGQQRLACADGQLRRVRIPGLRAETRYHIEELSLEAYGSTLMHAGLNLPLLGDFGSWCWHIRAAEEQ